MYAMCIGVVLVTGTVQRGEPRTRSVEVEEGTLAHSEEIVGELNVQTTLDFPEAIELLRCSDCQEIREDIPDARAAGSPAVSNWVVSRNAKEQPGLLHISPVEMPSESNPIDAFSSPLTVVLQSGHKIHIMLRLRNPRAGGRTPYDYWVSFELPGSERTSTQVSQRVSEKTDAIKTAFDAKVKAEVANLFLRRVRCSPLRWVTPTVEAKTRLWVTEACKTRDEPRAYVVRFVIENVGESLLTLQEAEFSPDSAVSGEREPSVYLHLPQAPVSAGGQAVGAAIYEVPEGHVQPPSWSLSVQPVSRPAVTIDVITFEHVNG